MVRAAMPRARAMIRSTAQAALAELATDVLGHPTAAAARRRPRVVVQ